MNAYCTPITAATAPLVRQWTNDRRVRKLLATFADRPAPLARIPSHERWTRNDEAYTGFRVACLSVLRAAILDPQFKAAEAADDYDRAKAIIAQPSVQAAVERAHVVLAPVTHANGGVWA